LTGLGKGRRESNLLPTQGGGSKTKPDTLTFALSQTVLTDGKSVSDPWRQEVDGSL
tara:strand:- start:505 stop:672 length:168 start_codon:yes stop_codon:yes gene_type:complete